MNAYILPVDGFEPGDEIALYDDIQILLQSPKVKKVKVYLNSAGGGAWAGFAIGDQFRRIKDNFEISVINQKRAALYKEIVKK